MSGLRYSLKKKVQQNKWGWFWNRVVGHLMHTIQGLFYALSESDDWTVTLKNFVYNDSLPHFMHDFSRKIFLTLYSLNWPDLIAWLSLLLETLGNVFIKITCFPVCDVLNFEINLIFLIKQFSYTAKKSGHKFKYLKKKKSFKYETKSIFHRFERAYSCQ